MVLQTNLNLFLRKAFCGLAIKKPLFYNWPIGLRFDLQTSVEEEYFAEVVHRAVTLFEEVFGLNEKIILICQAGRFKRDKIRFSNYCFQQINNLIRSEISYEKLRNLYDPNWVCEYYNRAILEAEVKRISYKNIVTAIANSDYYDRRPRIDLEVYFISLEREIIFNMYDNRGLNIIAANAQTVTHLYHKYNAWLLDYDREQMDNVFMQE